MLRTHIKSTLRKLNFVLGRSPRIVGRGHPRDYIPEPYRAVLLLTADFELAWAWRYSKDLENPIEDGVRLARRTRRNMPVILDLCDRNTIPVTWLTVGHLFLSGCESNGKPAHAELQRPPFFENDLWQFTEGDWFDHDPCSKWRQAPEWYAPDLIRQILASKVQHEIGCHTFSHINCQDELCPPEVLKSEIRECKQAAKPYGIEQESFVHPGHAIGNLDTLKESGFTSYRTDYGNMLGFPVRHPNGLWALPSTMELAKYRGWTLAYHAHFYRRIVERAIKHQRLCNLWFHPCVDADFVDLVLPGLFEFFASRKDEIWITTTKEYVAWLNARHA